MSASKQAKSNILFFNMSAFLSQKEIVFTEFYFMVIHQKISS